MENNTNLETNSTLPPVTPQTEPPVKKKKTKLYISLGIIVVLLVCGWVAYTAYASPSRVWQKFIANPQAPKIAQEDFSMSYQDNGTPSQEDSSANPLLGMFSGLKLSANGTSYTNNTDPANIENSTNLSYTFASGDNSMSGKANFIMKGQDLYFNLGNNPFVSSILSSLSPDQKIDWLKINFKDLQDMASATGTPPDYNTQVKAYQEILLKYSTKVLLLSKLIDRPTLHGAPTLHFSNTIDKTQLKAMMHEIFAYSFDQTAKQTQMSADELQKTKDTAYAVLDAMVDRAQIKDLETWIGTDGQLRRVKFSSTAPSLVSLMSQGSSMDESTSTDPSAMAKTVMQKVAFDGQVDMDAELYNFGQKQTVNTPANAFDLGAKLKEMKSMDQTRPGMVPSDVIQ